MSYQMLEGTKTEEDSSTNHSRIIWKINFNRSTTSGYKRIINLWSSLKQFLNWQFPLRICFFKKTFGYFAFYKVANILGVISSHKLRNLSIKMNTPRVHSKNTVQSLDLFLLLQNERISQLNIGPYCLQSSM